MGGIGEAPSERARGAPLGEAMEALAGGARKGTDDSGNMVDREKAASKRRRKHRSDSRQEGWWEHAMCVEVE